MKKLILIVSLIVTSALQGQVGLGTIKGKVFGTDSITAVPFAQVKIFVDGSMRGAKTDFNGKYSIEAIKPGTYNIEVGSGDKVRKLSNVAVNADQILILDFYLPPSTLDTIVVEWKPRKIEVNPIQTISTEELKGNINIRNPVKMIESKFSDVKVDQNNQVIIRGSRPGDVVYYIDGVKMTSMATVPGVAVRGIGVYTGGIPAKYGDTMGGVITLETKGYFDLYYAWKAKQ